MDKNDNWYIDNDDNWYICGDGDWYISDDDVGVGHCDDGGLCDDDGHCDDDDDDSGDVDVDLMMIRELYSVAIVDEMSFAWTGTVVD